MMPKQRPNSDLKYKFIRYLIAHEKYQRRFGYLKAAAEWTSRAIVSLDLHNGEIRSVKQAQQLEAIGGTITEKLKSAVNSSYSSMAPVKGIFASSASALLVTLYDMTEEARHINPDDENPVIHVENLRERCSEICEETFSDCSTLVAPVICNAWWRIKILEARNYVKKRTRSKKEVYQLLPMGFQIAERLKGIDVVDRKPPNSFTTVDGRNNEIVMQIDHREFGGDHSDNFNKMKHLLSKKSIKFQVKALQVGDYNWSLLRNGKEISLPVIVERKRADDFAESIGDGRYTRQREKMKKRKNEFRNTSELMQLIFLIEGNIQKYIVACGHECVGKCGNASVMEVATVLQDLENDPEFTVLHTPHFEKTVESLILITDELNMRLNAGDLNQMCEPLNSSLHRDSKDKNQVCNVIKIQHEDDTTSVQESESALSEIVPEMNTFAAFSENVPKMNMLCAQNDIPSCSKYADENHPASNFSFSDKDVERDRVSSPHEVCVLTDHADDDSDSSDSSQILYVSPFTYPHKQTNILWNEKISQLKTLFPHKHDTDFERVLSQVNGHVEAAVDLLLT